MGQRHMLNTPQIFETDSDQAWNYTEQPYMPMTGAGASESSSRIPPVDNMTMQGGHFPSQWNHAPRSSGYHPPVHNGELTYPQPQAPVPYRDSFSYQSTAGNFHMLQDNYSHHPSSSNLGGQTVPRADAGFYDQMAGNGRGSYKRKGPVRYYDVGTSSDLHLPADSWQDKPNTESYQTPWEHPSGCRVNTVSIGSEGTLRNVRSRAAADPETNLARNYMSSNPVRHPFPSQPNSGDFWGQSSNASSRVWNQGLIPPAGQGVNFGPDSNIFSHDPYTLNEHICRPSGSRDSGGYHNDVTTNRNTVPQHVNGNLNQSVRGVRSGYGQRAVPTFRASSSNFRPGMTASDEGLQIVAENYPPRHPRAFSTIRFRNLDRNGRTLVSSDRYRPSAEETSFRDRLTPEGLMGVDHSTYYGSRTLFDQHRDMRLDIDNMSYEELLALGERIGNVSTGLSDGLISKCLTESVYCSSDLFQEEATCVICLEEYKNMDDVGTLKACSHDYHVECIRKWLSMKNSCPICKATAIDEEK